MNQKMKLYHGSPKKLKTLKPQQAKGFDEFENQKAIFLTDSKLQAALYSLGKSLKGKTIFALPPNKLLVIGNKRPKKGYIYEVMIKGKKGIWGQYSYYKPIKKFKKIEIDAKEYGKYITYLKNKEELFKICLKEKKRWLQKKGYCIPILNFYISKVDFYLPTILRFLNPKKGEWNWENKILNKYPLLKKQLKGVLNFNLREKIIRNFFKLNHKRKDSLLKLKKDSFKKRWEKIGEDFFMALSETMGIYFPKKMKLIKGNITLNPICLRNISNNSFDIYYKFKLDQMVAVSMHEIFHFLYFEKCKKVFSKIKPKCDNLLALHLSEIIPHIILNTNKFQRIIKYKHKTYKEYFKIKINGKNLILRIEDILKRSKNFEEFLVNADHFMFKNKKKIKKDLKD